VEAPNETLGERIGKLNRGPLRPQQVSDAELDAFRRKLARRTQKSSRQPLEPILYRRDTPYSREKTRRRKTPWREPMLLEEAVQGIEADAPHGGKAYLIETEPAGREEDWASLGEVFLKLLLDEASNLRRRLRLSCGTGSLRPEDIIFIDLETTGLSSTPAFLIGTMEWEQGDLIVRQYLARNYAEEPAILSLSIDRAARKKLIVSFNGKSFDLPYLRTRAAAQRIPFSLDLKHFDLLHECRRAWKNVLPNCRLQTLESAICRRSRYGDIPSHEIPEAYHAFVHSGDASEIVEILRHNMLDLITLADLMTRLPAPDGAPE